MRRLIALVVAIGLLAGGLWLAIGASGEREPWTAKLIAGIATNLPFDLGVRGDVDFRRAWPPLLALADVAVADKQGRWSAVAPSAVVELSLGSLLGLEPSLQAISAPALTVDIDPTIMGRLAERDWTVLTDVLATTSPALEPGIGLEFDTLTLRSAGEPLAVLAVQHNAGGAWQLQGTLKDGTRLRAAAARDGGLSLEVALVADDANAQLKVIPGEAAGRHDVALTFDGQADRWAPWFLPPAFSNLAARTSSPERTILTFEANDTAKGPSLSAIELSRGGRDLLVDGTLKAQADGWHARLRLAEGWSPDLRAPSNALVALSALHHKLAALEIDAASTMLEGPDDTPVQLTDLKAGLTRTAEGYELEASTASAASIWTLDGVFAAGGSTLEATLDVRADADSAPPTDGPIGPSFEPDFASAILSLSPVGGRLESQRWAAPALSGALDVAWTLAAPRPSVRVAAELERLSVEGDTAVDALDRLRALDRTLALSLDLKSARVQFGQTELDDVAVEIASFESGFDIQRFAARVWDGDLALAGRIDAAQGALALDADWRTDDALRVLEIAGLPPLPAALALRLEGPVGAASFRVEFTADDLMASAEGRWSLLTEPGPSALSLRAAHPSAAALAASLGAGSRLTGALNGDVALDGMWRVGDDGPGFALAGDWQIAGLEGALSWRANGDGHTADIAVEGGSIMTAQALLGLADGRPVAPERWLRRRFGDWPSTALPAAAWPTEPVRLSATFAELDRVGKPPLTGAARLDLGPQSLVAALLLEAAEKPVASAALRADRTGDVVLAEGKFDVKGPLQSGLGHAFGLGWLGTGNLTTALQWQAGGRSLNDLVRTLQGSGHFDLNVSEPARIMRQGGFEVALGLQLAQPVRLERGILTFEREADATPKLSGTVDWLNGAQAISLQPADSAIRALAVGDVYRPDVRIDELPPAP